MAPGREEKGTLPVRLRGVLGTYFHFAEHARRPETLEDKCDGYVGDDSLTIPKQIARMNADVENRGGNLNSSQGYMLKERKDITFSNSKEGLSGSHKVDTQAWEGYDVGGGRKEKLCPVSNSIQLADMWELEGNNTDQSPDKLEGNDTDQSPGKLETTDTDQSGDKPEANDVVDIDQLHDSCKANDIDLSGDGSEASDIHISLDKPEMVDIDHLQDRCKASDVGLSGGRGETNDADNSSDKPEIDDIDKPSKKGNLQKDRKGQSTDTGNELGLKVTGEVDVSRDPVKRPEKTADVVLSLHTLSLPSSWGNKLYFAYIITALVLCPVDSTKLKPPGQDLPEMCSATLERKHDNDCPHYPDPFFEKWYEELNRICCKNFTHKMFHCQSDYDKSGDEYSMIACLTPVNISKGYAGRIANYGSRDPFFEREKLNDSQASVPARVSWEVTRAYHTRDKNQCRGIDHEILCQGDDNNLCTCRVGFMPSGNDCLSGFGDNAPCSCQRLDCLEGTHPARNFSHPVNGNCSSLLPNFRANFFCEDDPDPSGIPFTTERWSPAGVSVSTLSPSPEVTTQADENDREKDNSLALKITLGIVLSLLVLSVLIFLAIRYRVWIRLKLNPLFGMGFGRTCSSGSKSRIGGSESSNESPESVSLQSDPASGGSLD